MRQGPRVSEEPLGSPRLIVLGADPTRRLAPSTRGGEGILPAVDLTFPSPRPLRPHNRGGGGGDVRPDKTRFPALLNRRLIRRMKQKISPTRDSSPRIS